jgi:hypothetical protein
MELHTKCEFRVARQGATATKRQKSQPTFNADFLVSRIGELNTTKRHVSTRLPTLMRIFFSAKGAKENTK